MTSLDEFKIALQIQGLESEMNVLQIEVETVGNPELSNRLRAIEVKVAFLKAQLQYLRERRQRNSGADH